jgi:hypothetical protein
MIIENKISTGTAVLGEIKSVIRGIARMEKPNPESPCSMAETRKMKLPIKINSVSMLRILPQKYCFED